MRATIPCDAARIALSLGIGAPGGLRARIIERNGMSLSSSRASANSESFCAPVMPSGGAPATSVALANRSGYDVSSHPATKPPSE